MRDEFLVACGGYQHDVSFLHTGSLADVIGSGLAPLKPYRLNYSYIQSKVVQPFDESRYRGQAPRGGRDPGKSTLSELLLWRSP
ncbi:MAG: hypothetical protein KAH44_19620, partial [Oricola sp.]|nr:hypothetical protein [Oricola sp.]